jgi:hypothetical protein
VAPVTAAAPVASEPASAPTRSSNTVCCLIQEPPSRSVAESLALLYSSKLAFRTGVGVPVSFIPVFQQKFP